MTVAQYESPPPLPASRPGDELLPGPVGRVARLRAAAEYATFIADTPFVPESLRGKPAEITAALLTGEELGLEPMASLRSIAIIRGRPTISAEAQRGLIAAAGHELWFEESTVTRAIAAGRRAGSDRVTRITWTLDDAKRAGIAGGENYRRYPAEMLRARSSAALARATFSDVTLGILAAEELEGEPDNGAAPPDGPLPATPEDAPTPPAAGSRTRRRPSARKAATKPREPAEPARAPVPPTPPPDEQTPPEPDPEPKVTDAYKRQIFALMRDVGFVDGDREGRLAYTARIAGRPLESSNDLTIGEATRVIADLREIRELGPEDRARRMVGADEAAVVAELDQLAAEGGDAPPADEQGAEASNEPVPYGEFPDGF